MPPLPPQKVDYPRYVDSLWCIYTVSVLSAWNAEFVTYPLDLIKTRLQIQGEKAKSSKIGMAPHRGFIQTTVGIVTEEGPLKLWQGIHAVMLRHLIYSGSRIVIYRDIKDRIIKSNPPEQKELRLWQSALCGVSAGAIAQYIASPADLLKVQLQMEGKRKLLGLPPRVKGLVDAFNQTWSAGGIRGLWKGSIPNVQRAALVNLGDLTTYDVAKRFIMSKTGWPDAILVHILSSTCAGFVAAGMGTPADVIKTRVMNQPFDEKGRGVFYANSMDCFRRTISEEGVGALYKGFIPTWIRLGPWALVFWITYEKIMNVIGGKGF